MTTFSTLPDALARDESRAAPRRVPALDGIRALAVAAVVLYHLSPSLLPGGFLGVDAFFVLSGYLVTCSLLRGRGVAGTSLRAFWLRRTRRIVPALLVMLLTTTVVVGAVGRDTDVRLAPQLLSTLTFTNNWYQAIEGSSYFDATTPPVFQHLWSVAVEEQFYLVWPLVVVPFVRHSRRLSALSAWTFAAAIASAGLMAAWFAPGHDPSRIYFGTATHGSGLLVGSALALALAASGPSRRQVSLPRWTTASAAAVAVALVVYLPDVSALTYRGGIFVFSVCVAVVMAGIVLAPGAGAGQRLLSAPWATWAGRRSYGIYLWHWPATVVTTALIPARPVWVHALVVVPVTVLCASASWRYVERPVLEHGLASSARSLWCRAQRSRLSAALAATCVVLTVVSVGTAVVRSPSASAVERSVTVGQSALRSQETPGTADATGTARPSAGPDASEDQARPVAPRGIQVPRDGEAPPPSGSGPSRPAGGDQVTVIGDSVTLASAPALLEALPGIEVSASVGMQMRDAPELMSRLHHEGRLRPVVVVALGTNGSFSTETLDAVLEASGPDREVFFVTAHAPRPWTKSVNRRLAEYVESHPGSALVDWDRTAETVDDFAPDGIHPGPRGAQVLSELLADALEARS